MQSNTDIRTLIFDKRLRYWEIAKEIGISHVTLSVWMREELTEERKKLIINAINKLSN